MLKATAPQRSHQIELRVSPKSRERSQNFRAFHTHKRPGVRLRPTDLPLYRLKQFFCLRSPQTGGFGLQQSREWPGPHHAAETLRIEATVAGAPQSLAGPQPKAAPPRSWLPLSRVQGQWRHFRLARMSRPSNLFLPTCQALEPIVDLGKGDRPSMYIGYGP